MSFVAKLQLEEEVGKQGENLACWFEQMMELGDASDKEVPTTNPGRRDLTKSEQLEVIAMLVMTATEDHLQRGGIMKLTKRFNMASAWFTDYGNAQHACMPWA